MTTIRHVLVMLSMAALLAPGCGAKTALEEPPPPPPPPPCTDSFGAQPQLVCTGTEVPVDATWPGEGAMDLVASGCGLVLLVVATDVGPALLVSESGGARFDGPRPLPRGVIGPRGGAPHFETVAALDDGTLLALVRGVGDVLRVDRSDDLGRMWREGPTLDGTEDAWGGAILASGAQVVVHWMNMGTGTPRTIALVRSLDGGRTFSRREAPGYLRATSYDPPSVCLAGTEGVVVGWLGCDAADCVGEDRTGTSVAGVWSIGVGGIARSEIVYVLDDGWRAPLAGCAPDGRAMLGWSTEPYAGGDTGALVIASHAACGAREIARVPHTGIALQSVSPRPVLGASGAFVDWGGWLESSERTAVLDAEGRLGPIMVDRDLDGDARFEVVTGACGLAGGGYAVLFTSDRRTTAMRGRGIGAILDEGGDVVETRMLGPFDGRPGDWAGVRCDGAGRAHFAWIQADGWHYAGMGPRREP